MNLASSGLRSLHNSAMSAGWRSMRSSFTLSASFCSIKYCDNDPDKVGKDIAGLAVRPLDDWIEGADDICYVVAAKAASDEIVRQLLESGILRENIMIFDLPCDFSVL